MSEPEHIKPVIKRVMKKFRLTPPKPFIPKEYSEQEQVILWAHGRPQEHRVVRAKGGGQRHIWLPAIPAQCKDPRIALLFSTLNGVRLPVSLAVKMKRAGNRPGVPDLILPVVGYAGCPGLFIELKRTKGGEVSAVQKEWHEALRKQGYQVVVAKGAKEAIAVISDYLAAAKEGG